MYWYYEYLKLYRDGKPMSQWVIKALDRVPYYLSHYNYNERYPKRLISFMENSLYLQKGDTGSKIQLEIEQKFWIELLGFEYDDGRPVITDLGLIIGAGSGKSTFMAGLALAVMIVDSHRGQDVLVMSNSVNQSQNTFRTATDMVSDDRSPLYDFKKMDLIQPIQGKIRWTPTNSQIEIKAMDNKTADGVNVRMAIFDEFHSYTTNVIENIRKSSAPKRKGTGFTTVYISTNGVTRDSVFDSYFKRWERILDGEIEDYSTFPMIYQLDDLQESTDITMYEKAMPFVKSISDPQITYENFMKTKGNPVAQAEFLAKSFNIPQSQYNSLFTTQELERAIAPHDFYFDNQVYVGWDLSAKNDLSSVAIFWESDGKIKVKSHAWLPKITMSEHTNKEQRLHYANFIANDELTLQDGGNIDSKDIFDWLQDYIYSNGLQVVGMGGDSYYAKEFIKLMTDEFGADKYKPYRPITNVVSEPTQLIKGKIAEDNAQLLDTLMVWSLNNVNVKVDAAGQVYPNKQKSADKIDPVWAFIMAYRAQLDDLNDNLFEWG